MFRFPKLVCHVRSKTKAGIISMTRIRIPIVRDLLRSPWGVEGQLIPSEEEQVGAGMIRGGAAIPLI